jgi:hypothetical protein
MCGCKYGNRNLTFITIFFCMGAAAPTAVHVAPNQRGASTRTKGSVSFSIPEEKYHYQEFVYI